MGTDTSSGGTSVKRRILVVDSHPLVRRGLTTFIESEPDLSVCAAVATRRAAIEAIASHEPDLVITELSLGDADGPALLQALLSVAEGPPVLVLSMHDEPRYVRAAFTAGARGYVTKQEMSETLLLAIRQVLEGETHVGPKIGSHPDEN